MSEEQVDLDTQAEETKAELANKIISEMTEGYQNQDDLRIHHRPLMNELLLQLHAKKDTQPLCYSSLLAIAEILLENYHLIESIKTFQDQLTDQGISFDPIVESEEV